MKLSIITITYNNLAGLKGSVESVLKQNYRNWELIVVDGGSSDGTKEWLQATASLINKIGNESHVSQQESLTSNNHTDIGIDEQFRYVSEPDKGIYNAQNKGIQMAEGEYCFFLNAGDEFCDNYVLEKMLLGEKSDIVYGNEIEVFYEEGKILKKSRVWGVENPTMVDIYLSCMKHQATFIKRSLFDRFGAYDESLKICADWEWFFRVIGFNDDVSLHYKNVDVALFEAGGYSYTHPDICKKEKEIIINKYIQSSRLKADLDFLAHYKRLREAEINPVLRFLLRFTMWCVKFFMRKH